MLLGRSAPPRTLQMDGIAVQAERRGEGVGSLLLSAIVAVAHDHGMPTVRLDVIDTNPGAERLYRRFGFSAVRTERVPYLRRLYGFSAATTMEYTVGVGHS